MSSCWRVPLQRHTVVSSFKMILHGNNALLPVKFNRLSAVLLSSKTEKTLAARRRGFQIPKMTEGPTYELGWALRPTILCLP